MRRPSIAMSVRSPFRSPASPTDHYTTDEADLPFPGRWELEVGVLLSDVDRAIVTATVDIS